MSDPTPLDHERAHGYAWRDGLCIAATKSAPHGMACGVIATALADQRERDAGLRERVIAVLRPLLKHIKISGRTLRGMSTDMMLHQSSDPHLRNSTAHKLNAQAIRLNIRWQESQPERQEIKDAEAFLKDCGGEVWG